MRPPIANTWAHRSMATLSLSLSLSLSHSHSYTQSITVFSLGSVLVASLPCVHQSINHEPHNSGEAQPLTHSSIREGCNACDGNSTDQVQCSSSCQMWRNYGHYNHEEQFQVGSPEEAINHVGLNYALEVNLHVHT